MASQNDTLKSPAAGILCDQYFCADKQGISNGLTVQYLGKALSDKLIAPGSFDRSAFTFENGIFCDVNEQRCYEDRYHDTKSGKRSPVSLYYTTTLFGGPSLHQSRKWASAVALLTR